LHLVLNSSLHSSFLSVSAHFQIHAVAVMLSFNFNLRRNPALSLSGSDAFLPLFSNVVIVSQFLLALSPYRWALICLVPLAMAMARSTRG
jgi:hypothetical protein